MTIIILIIYGFFIITALAVRCIGGDYDLRLRECDPTVAPNGKRKYKKVAWVIGGLLDQPDRVMRYIDLPGYQIIAIMTDVFGYSIRQLANILDEYAGEDDIAIGISIGAQAVVKSSVGTQILINPCIDPLSLGKKERWFLAFAAPLLEAVSFLLGWLSFIPFIPMNKGHFSIATLADQLIAIEYGFPLLDRNANIGAIISTDDEFLDNEIIASDILEQSPTAGIVEVKTKHARIGDKKDAPKYQAALNYLLK